MAILVLFSPLQWDVRFCSNCEFKITRFFEETDWSTHLVAYDSWDLRFVGPKKHYARQMRGQN